MDQRIQELRSQLEGDPSSRVFFQLGEALRRTDARTEAIKVLTAGLEHHPRYVGGWICLGRCRHEESEFTKAREAFNKALELDPENLVAHQMLGQGYSQQGDWLEAIKCLKRARAMSQGDPSLDDQIAELEEHLTQGAQPSAPAPAAEPAPQAEAAPAEEAAPEEVSESEPSDSATAPFAAAPEPESPAAPMESEAAPFSAEPPPLEETVSAVAPLAELNGDPGATAPIPVGQFMATQTPSAAPVFVAGADDPFGPAPTPPAVEVEASEDVFGADPPPPPLVAPVAPVAPVATVAPVEAVEAAPVAALGAPAAAMPTPPAESVPEAPAAAKPPAVTILDANRAIDEGDRFRAIIILETILEEDPGAWDAMQMLDDLKREEPRDTVETVDPEPIAVPVPDEIPEAEPSPAMVATVAPEPQVDEPMPEPAVTVNARLPKLAEDGGTAGFVSGESSSQRLESWLSGIQTAARRLSP